MINFKKYSNVRFINFDCFVNLFGAVITQVVFDRQTFTANSVGSMTLRFLQPRD